MSWCEDIFCAIAIIDGREWYVLLLYILGTCLNLGFLAMITLGGFCFGEDDFNVCRSRGNAIGLVVGGVLFLVSVITYMMKNIKFSCFNKNKLRYFR